MFFTLNRLNRPASIVLARIIVWIPTFILLFLGWLSVTSIYRGYKLGRAISGQYQLSNNAFLFIHQSFGWDHTTNSSWKATVIALLFLAVLLIYLTLYWQSGQRGNYNNILMLTISTFFVSYAFTYWFNNLGYYLLFGSTAMLLLFLLPSSRRYYTDQKSNRISLENDILDAEI